MFIVEHFDVYQIGIKGLSQNKVVGAGSRVSEALETNEDFWSEKKKWGVTDSETALAAVLT